MIKYDYKGAAALWDEYYNLVCDPWTFGTDERQEERRHFLRALTRNNITDKHFFIGILLDNIEDMRPADNAKEKIFYFDDERQLETLADKIARFKGVL